MLVTVYFPKKTEPFYRKAIVDKNDRSFFIRNGAKETQLEAEIVNNGAEDEETDETSKS